MKAMKEEMKKLEFEIDKLKDDIECVQEDFDGNIRQLQTDLDRQTEELENQLIYVHSQMEEIKDEFVLRKNPIKYYGNLFLKKLNEKVEKFDAACDKFLCMGD